MISKLLSRKHVKITPLIVHNEVASSSISEENPPLKMRVVSLHDLLKRYGRQRHPYLDSFETMKESGCLIEFRYVPNGSTLIYISHEWSGTNHPDPNGTQMYHLLYLLERLQKGEISRTDMDAVHRVLYKQNHSTTAKEWKHILNPEKTYIWYDGFSVPRSRREDGFRSIPSYLQRCNFMIILAPGCTHFDRVDPRTQRKMNLCYRTYRLQAHCVFELFSAFLTTKGGQRAKLALLVRSGTGYPNWISPLECQKLAVGTSKFQCCESNHVFIQKCRKTFVHGILDRLIDTRVQSLFVSNNFADARFSLCMRNYWFRGLINNGATKKTWSSFSSFKTDLKWSSSDGTTYDRDGFPILLYAALTDCVDLVISTLSTTRDATNPTFQGIRSPKKGLPTFGVSGFSTPLMGAMGFASPSIVSALLKSGVDPFETDRAGNDAFIFASVFGRLENVKFWLKQYSDWDIESRNKMLGGTALSATVYTSPNKLELVKLLLELGANVDSVSFAGVNILMTACASEDADPSVIYELLKSTGKIVNTRAKSRALKWKVLRSLAKMMIRFDISSSQLVSRLANGAGITALHYAVRRGDVDIVNLLLEHGADPTIKNDLGKTPMDYTDAFPELRGALKRVVHHKKTNKTNNFVTLRRRNSTATDMKFPMYLVPLDQLHRLYGGKDPHHPRIEAHQELKRRGELVRWEDLSIDAHIIFFSHEWVGWNHPDPHGIQLKTFLKVMKRLRLGEISQVQINIFHTMLYKTNHVVRADKWKEILSTAYVWIDWASMPQPSACPASIPREKKQNMGTDLGKAVKSIPACVIISRFTSSTLTYTLQYHSNRYIEKADFVAIVAPGCLHTDRRDPVTKLRTKTCYRTYRKRGWCVLEMVCSMLSREKVQPALLITSAGGTPEFVSPMNAQNLAVGMCDFTCCQRNHIFPGIGVVPCDRVITRKILERMVRAKTKHLFDLKHNTLARLCSCLESWWLRRSGDSMDQKVSKNISSLKRELRWNDEENEWLDGDGISILFYAVLRNDNKAVRLLLLPTNHVGKDWINEYVANEGYVQFGIPGRFSTLTCAMCFADVSIVSMLLESGANPKVTDINGADSLIYASTLGRVRNIKFWLCRFPSWNINRANTVNGSTALHTVLFILGKTSSIRFELSLRWEERI
jgi:ankyrin repeat protein